MIYKFTCAGCNASYIGETARHIKTRIDEHIRKDKLSQVYKHLHETESCFDSYHNECFCILDTARTKYQRKLKEGLYIDWENPELNRQIKHISSTLAV